jgi:hypothetical protein
LFANIFQIYASVSYLERKYVAFAYN